MSTVSSEQALKKTTMLTTLEMARAEFGFYAAHLALYNGEVEPLHGHTFPGHLARVRRA